MRILGIDPGLNTTGYGVIDAFIDSAECRRSNKGFDTLRVIEAGVIKTSPKEKIEARVHKIHEGILQIINETKPEILVLEKLYSHYKHPITAILMGHARGIACLVCGEVDIPLISYPATRIKKVITGNGNASKEQVKRMIQKFLQLKTDLEQADVADALALAVGHVYIRRAIVNQLTNNKVIR